MSPSSSWSRLPWLSCRSTTTCGLKLTLGRSGDDGVRGWGRTRRKVCVGRALGRRREVVWGGRMVALAPTARRSELLADCGRPVDMCMPLRVVRKRAVGVVGSLLLRWRVAVRGRRRVALLGRGLEEGGGEESCVVMRRVEEDCTAAMLVLDMLGWGSRGEDDGRGAVEGRAVSRGASGPGD